MMLNRHMKGHWS